MKLYFLTVLLAIGSLFPIAIYSKDTPKIDFTARDLHCLASNIYFESRGEQKKGQLAVAHVTLNRVKSGKFASSICEVVQQKNQFSWTKNYSDIFILHIPIESYQLALNVLTNTSYKYSDPTSGALFFHNNTVPEFNRTIVAQIGNHIFYR